MDLDLRVDKIEEWLKTLPIFYQKVNIAPWGSYQVAVSWDNRTYSIINRFFGYGFTESRAFATIVEDCLSKNEQSVLGWFGDRRSTLEEMWRLMKPADSTVTSSLESTP